jgi:DNA-binding CsgD family transcriptional regulator
VIKRPTWEYLRDPTDPDLLGPPQQSGAGDAGRARAGLSRSDIGFPQAPRPYPRPIAATGDGTRPERAALRAAGAFRPVDAADAADPADASTRTVSTATGPRPLLRNAFDVPAAVPGDLAPDEHAPDALISRFERPVLLIDAARRIRFENGAATEALARLEYVLRREDRLHCTLPEHDEAFGRALGQLQLDGRARTARTPDRRFVRIETVSDRVPVCTYLVALRAPHKSGPERHDASALVFFHDVRQNPGLDPAIVADTFGLTPAEARLAVTLASGIAVKTIAAQRKVEVSTVRTQLRSILAKTGTNRQAELVRVLLGLPAIRSR